MSFGALAELGAELGGGRWNCSAAAALSGADVQQAIRPSPSQPPFAAFLPHLSPIFSRTVCFLSADSSLTPASVISATV